MLEKLGAVSYRLARRIVIGLLGGTVLLVGIVMTVTPGPAVLVIPIGLGILGLEFAWARLWLQKLKDGVSPEGLKRVTEQYARLKASLTRKPPPSA